MERNYWGIHFGEANKFANLGYEKGFVAVSFKQAGDPSFLKESDRAAFRASLESKFKEASPELTDKQITSYLGQLFTFITLARVGDVVVSPKTDEGKAYVGVIDSDYYYETAPTDGCEFSNRRKVRWVREVDLRDVSEKLKYSLGAIGTFFSIGRNSEELESYVAGSVALQPATAEASTEFVLESHLEDFLIANWKSLTFGQTHDVLSEEGQQTGQQYVTPVGRIDILARSKDSKEWLVVELKKGRTSDEVLGQTLRYMGWLEANLLSPGETVKGLIVVHTADDKLLYALRKVNDISVMTYSVQFQLKPVTQK